MGRIRLGEWTLLAGCLVLAAIATVLVLDMVLDGGRAKVEAKLNGSLAGSAKDSGRDAVETVGSAGASEDAIDERVSDVQEKVRSAPDAAGADRAGRDGLCAITPDLC
jgi:hypothetical protein